MYRAVVKPGTVVRDCSFQTASWWREVELEPGEYEFKHYTSGMYWVSIPGTIVRDYFASNFAGASYQPYDTEQNTGKPTHYSTMRYDYQLKENPVVEIRGEK